MNPSETEVAEMCKDVDPEGRGTFNQNALCSLIARRPKAEESMEDMVESLKILCGEQNIYFPASANYTWLNYV